MARWLIFAAWRADNPALWNSYWIAAQTRRLAPTPPIVIERERAVRKDLEEALADETLEGVALFGHGEPHAVMGSDRGEALDLDNVKLVGAKWAHALACDTGLSLVQAAAPHADIFVGYRTKLILQWTTEELPAELHELLARLVVATTLGLLAGVRAGSELQARVMAAAEELEGWLHEKWVEDQTDDHLGLHVLAEQLVERMVTSR